MKYSLRLKKTSLECIQTGCQPGLIWWRYMSISKFMWISQLHLGVFLKLLFIKKNSELKEFTVFFSMNGSFNIEKVLLQKDNFMILYMHMLYLIIFSTLSWSVPTFHVYLSIIYQLFLPSLYKSILYMMFFLNICKGVSL